MVEFRQAIQKYIDREACAPDHTAEDRVIAGVSRGIGRRIAAGVVLNACGLEFGAAFSGRSSQTERIEIRPAVEVIHALGALQKIHHRISQRSRQHLIRHFEKVSGHNQVEHHTRMAVPRR